MKKKAISPVISVMLLIAITVAGVAIFYVWNEASQGSMHNLQYEASMQAATSSQAQIKIIEVNRTAVTVSNIGLVNTSGLLIKPDSPDGYWSPTRDVAPNNKTTYYYNSYPLSGSNIQIKVISEQGASALYQYVG